MEVRPQSALQAAQSIADPHPPHTEHDLVPRMTPFLDPHMLFPLLGYLKELQVRRVRALL